MTRLGVPCPGNDGGGGEDRHYQGAGGHADGPAAGRTKPQRTRPLDDPSIEIFLSVRC